LYSENDAKIFPAHGHTWTLAEKGLKMVLMMNKLAMINSFEIILEFFFAENHCEIQVCTILICALCSIKYGTINILKKQILHNYVSQWRSTDNQAIYGGLNIPIILSHHRFLRLRGVKNLSYI
jgi:hypothetical protein